ncbi:hypothetical protein HDV04_004281 [Boothiomyces sp. JEL0838]|nr:hypothetical protein HDV04_004281 [Boothiomyces sp. JEL0838]
MYSNSTKDGVDSAYGSPKYSELYGSPLSDIMDDNPLDDQWRYIINPQDVLMDGDMYKPYVKQIYLGEFENETCAPCQIFQEASDDEIFEMEEEEPQPLPRKDPSKPFQCPMCTSSFSRNHDLKRHVRIHLGIRPYKCDTCPKSFTRMDALHRHSTVKGCKGMQRKH